MPDFKATKETWNTQLGKLKFFVARDSSGRFFAKTELITKAKTLKGYRAFVEGEVVVKKKVKEIAKREVVAPVLERPFVSKPLRKVRVGVARNFEFGDGVFVPLLDDFGNPLLEEDIYYELKRAMSRVFSRHPVFEYDGVKMVFYAKLVYEGVVFQANVETPVKIFGIPASKKNALIRAANQLYWLISGSPLDEAYVSFVEVYSYVFEEAKAAKVYA